MGAHGLFPYPGDKFGIEGKVFIGEAGLSDLDKELTACKK